MIIKVLNLMYKCTNVSRGGFGKGANSFLEQKCTPKHVMKHALELVVWTLRTIFKIDNKIL